MLKEQATIVAVEANAIWVQTIQSSTCGSCVAKKGCGQALFAGLGAKPNHLRVVFDDDYPSSRYQLNQSVTIGLPESIVVKASLFLYLLPLALLMLFGAIGQNYNSNELFVIGMSALGLFLGGLLLRLFSEKYKNDRRFQPRVIEAEPLAIINSDASVHKPTP